MSTVLAFDFGEKRTGVAVGETTLKQAHPLTVIRAGNNDDRLAVIEELIRKWQPKSLVVGLPTHMDGTPHLMTEQARAFSKNLEDRFHLPVSEVDERLSSYDAEVRLRETGRAGRASKPLVDAIAAQLILQTWLDTLP